MRGKVKGSGRRSNGGVVRRTEPGLLRTRLLIMSRFAVTKSGDPIMKKLWLMAAVAASTVGLPVIAEAAPAFSTGNVNMRSGPSTQYPPVIVIPVGSQVDIRGCLSSANWCDVAYAGYRGWVSGSYLQASYSQRRVYVDPQYYRPLGIPTVTFSITATVRSTGTAIAGGTMTAGATVIVSGNATGIVMRNATGIGIAAAAAAISSSSTATMRHSSMTPRRSMTGAGTLTGPATSTVRGIRIPAAVTI
jgi:uncharacterized protein YraI